MKKSVKIGKWLLGAVATLIPLALVASGYWMTSLTWVGVFALVVMLLAIIDLAIICFDCDENAKFSNSLTYGEALSKTAFGGACIALVTLLVEAIYIFFADGSIKITEVTIALLYWLIVGVAVTTYVVIIEKGKSPFMIGAMLATGGSALLLAAKLVEVFWGYVTPDIAIKCLAAIALFGFGVCVLIEFKKLGSYIGHKLGIC